MHGGRFARTASWRAVPAPLARGLTLGVMLLALAAAVCLRPVTTIADVAGAAPAPAASTVTAQDQVTAGDHASAADYGEGDRHCAKKKPSTEAPNAPQAAHDAALAPVIKLPRPAHAPTPRDGGHYTGPAPPAPSPVSLSILRI